MAFASGLETLTGTRIYIGAGVPATEDKAGYEAVTVTQIVGVVSFGEWGDSQNDVTEPLLGDGRNIHLNGLKDGGSVETSIQHQTIDAGSDIILANDGSNTLFTIKKLYKSGDAEYAVGILSSPKFREAINDGVRGYMASMGINSTVTPVPA